jgi:hypothetical protein
MAPKTEHFDRLTILVVDHLPEAIEERKRTLQSLLAILPASYPHRDDVQVMVDAITDHQAHQLQFKALLSGKARPQ